MIRLSDRTRTGARTGTLKTVAYGIAATIAWLLITVYYLLSR
jgi:hypothetical protein